MSNRLLQNDPDVCDDAMNDSAPDSLDEQELLSLRNLLSGPLEERISVLEERIENEEITPEEISRVLPEAIRHRATVDDKIGKALETSMASAIKTSINKDRKILADALFPILGPAIRKAIGSTILGMIQSFNQILEHTFSIEGLKWRIEALTTNKSFAEIVLLKTLLFQVEQVFLIHRESGLLLQHVVAKEVEIQDPDLISGMLTAIQDFVFDSFSSEKENDLDTLRMGLDKSVWIDRGPYAILATVIRGTPRLELRADFREVLSLVHIQEGEALASFEGDTTPFDRIRSHLESCLQFQIRSKETKVSSLLWLLIFVVIGFVTMGAVFFIQEQQKWAIFFDKLSEKPGMVISKTEKRSGIYHIYGLRDPLSGNAEKIIQEAGIKMGTVKFHWEDYQSFYPAFLLKRVLTIMEPPTGILFELNDGLLVAKGEAPHQWIIETRKRIKLIPGITGYQDDKIVDMDKKDFLSMRQIIEKKIVYFSLRETEFSDEVGETLLDFSNVIKTFFQLDALLKTKCFLDIEGHADSDGNNAVNLDISQKRAESVRDFLVSQRINPMQLRATGLGSSKPLKEEITDSDKVFNRCVTFRIMIESI